MKLKHVPDDFVVIETAALTPGPQGPVAAYRLHKVGCGTPEAVSRAARLLEVGRAACAYAGLKDTAARTEQWLTVEHGAPVSVEDDVVRCEYVGQVAAPIRRADLQHNTFVITLRDGSAEQAAAAVAGLRRCAEHGLPNYFDTQRFGSARATGEFPGKHVITGDPEVAVRLLIATPGPDDHGRLRQTRETCARMWGEWAELVDALPKGPEQAVVRHLVRHPTDFVGAFERWPRDLRQLVLSAWQSWLWNRIVAAWLARELGPLGHPIETGWQRLVRWEALDPDRAARFGALEIPLPHHEAEYDPEWRALAADVLGSEGVTVEGLFPRKLKQTHLHRGQRALVLRPFDVEVGAPEPDAYHPGRFAVRLQFALPPGSYATMVVRCLGLDARTRRRSSTPVGPRRDR